MFLVSIPFKRFTIIIIMDNTTQFISLYAIDTGSFSLTPWNITSFYKHRSTKINILYQCTLVKVY